MDVVPQIEGELGFQTGDLITVTEVVDDDWFYGQCHNKVGLVSTICVEFLDDFGDDSEPSAGSSILESSAEADSSYTSGGGSRELELRQDSFSKESQGVGSIQASAPSESSYFDYNLTQHTAAYTSENTRSHDAEITPYAKTLYPFQAQLPTELSFGGDEIVTLIQHVDEDWIEGELDGKIGVFPATFVEIIVDCPYAYNTSKAPEPQRLENFTHAENHQKANANKEFTAKESHDSETVHEQEIPKEPSVSQNGHCAGSSSESQVNSQALPQPEEGSNGSSDQQASSTVVCDPSLALVLHSFQGEVQGDLTVKEGDTVEVLRIVDSDWLEARDDQGTVGLVPKNHVQVISGGAPQSMSNKSFKVQENASGEISSSAGDSAPSENTQQTPCVKKRAAGETTVSGVTRPILQSSARSSDQGVSTTSSVFRAPQPDSTHTGGGRSGDQSVPQDSHRHNQRSVQSAPVKPALHPKPKLALKPVIKPKPSLTHKPSVPTHGSPRESTTGRVAPPSEKRASVNVGGGDGCDPDAKDKKVFTGINTGLSLDNLVQVELEKAKSEGERSRGSSFIEDEKQSRSGSFSSTDSDEQPTVSAPLDSQRNNDVARVNLGKIEESSASQNARSQAVPTDKPPKLLVNQSDVTTNSGLTLRTGRNGTGRPLSSSDLNTLLPSPATHLNRSTSDAGFSVAAGKGSEAPPASPKASHRHSMPPVRPMPPPPPKADSKRHSFVNPGFEHESEGQLVSLDATEASRPPPPSRALPPPPPPPPALSPASRSADQDLLGGNAERRVKRPPPRPSGPRVASVPSKTPLLPVIVAPSNRRSAHVAPGLVPLLAPPSRAVPPRPASVAVAATAAATAAATTPPKRPPPRLQKSPNDLMRFSPEPVTGELVCRGSCFTLYGVTG